MKKKIIIALNSFLIGALFLSIVSIHASFTYYQGKAENADVNLRPTMSPDFDFASLVNTAYPNEYTEDQKGLNNLNIFDTITGGIKATAPSDDNDGFKIYSESDHKHTLANSFSSINKALLNLDINRDFISSEDYISVRLEGKDVFRPTRKYFFGDENNYNFNFIINRKRFDNNQYFTYSILTCYQDISNLEENTIVEDVYQTSLIYEKPAHYIFSNVKGKCKVIKKSFVNEAGNISTSKKNILDYNNFEYF